MSLIMIMLNKKVVTLVDRLLTISDEPLVMARIRVCMEARGFTKCAGASPVACEIVQSEDCGNKVADPCCNGGAGYTYIADCNKVIVQKNIGKTADQGHQKPCTRFSVGDKRLWNCTCRRLKGRNRIISAAYSRQ